MKNGTRGQMGWGTPIAELFDMFGGDHTHTNEEGAKLSGSVIAEGLGSLKDGKLAECLKGAR